MSIAIKNSLFPLLSALITEFFREPERIDFFSVIAYRKNYLRYEFHCIYILEFDIFWIYEFYSSKTRGLQPNPSSGPY